MKLKTIIGLCAALLFLGGCSEKISFRKGDIKDDFCAYR
jgi:hypothetical protein